MELFCAVDNHAEFCTVSSLDSVSIVLPVINTYVISTMYSLSRVFVTLTMNRMILLGSNNITCTLKT